MIPAGVVFPPNTTAPVVGLGEELLPLYSTTSKKAFTIVAPAGGAHCMVIT